MRRSSLAALAALGALAGLVVAAAVAAPRVTAFSPTEGEPQVSGRAQFAITFSQPMKAASVEARLRVEPETKGRVLWDRRTLVFVPDVPWPAGSVVKVRLEAGARSARGLPLLRQYEWSFAPTGPRVAYLWPAGGVAQVYARAAAEAESIALTEAPLGVYDFTVVLDSQALLLVTEGEADGTDIWLHPLQGSSPRLLWRCGAGRRCRTPRLSPDGSFLAFEQSELRRESAAGAVPGPTRVWALDIRQEGGVPYPLGPEGHLTSAPSWSPQGLLVYYDGTLRAFVLVDPIRGPEPPPYRYFASELGGAVAWFPDGSSFVYPDMIFPAAEAAFESETDQPLFYSHLFRGQVESGTVADLWRAGTGRVEDASPAISADGQWIAFGRKYLEADRWTLGRQLWLMRSDGTGARALTNAPDINHSAVAWSQDSEWLAFMRFNEATPTEAAEIWLIRRNGEGETRLAIGGYLPQWIP